MVNHLTHWQHSVYDAENRLIKAEGTGPEGRFTAQYHYDALGRRIRKTVTTQRATSETRFLWQGYRLLQEQQKDRCRTYVYDPNEACSPLARIDHLRDDSQGDICWFSTDLNGAPVDVTDEQGSICWSGQYGSFGEVRYQSDGFSRLLQNGTPDHQPLRYAGQYADSETGLHYNPFRYYDPQVGRFTVQDPIGLAGGLNLYQYTPNPLGWIDPLGLYAGEGQRELGRYHVFHEHILNTSEFYLSDREHFKIGNQSIYERMHSDPSFRRDMQKKYPGLAKHVQPGASGRFKGDAPPGMTWHHENKLGVLSLVDYNDHNTYHKIYHPDGSGGRKKWGGGAGCR